MNIIRQKTTNMVMYITERDVFELDGTFACDDAKLGLHTQEYELVQGPAPQQMYFPQCMTFDGAVWGIYDQAWYDMCWSGYCAEHNAKQKAARATAYAQECDPLFFKCQRGEATQADWIFAVDRVRARFPYIGVSDPSPAEQPAVEGAQTL